MEQHAEELTTHCRFCGSSLAKQRVTYSCQDHTESVMKAFGINVRTDQESVHPPRFCHKCFCSLRRSPAHFHLFKWVPHSEPTCAVRTRTIYDHLNSLKRPGRPKKAKNRGRPASNSKILLHKAISNSAHTSNTNPKEYVFYTTSPVARKDIECPLCCNVLCEPVQLDCGEIVCSGCCHQWVEAASQPSCPCCYRGHPFTPASIRQAPSIITTVLDSVIITCNKCNHNLQAGEHLRHLDMQWMCREYTPPLTFTGRERE